MRRVRQRAKCHITGKGEEDRGVTWVWGAAVIFSELLDFCPPCLAWVLGKQLVLRGCWVSKGSSLFSGYHVCLESPDPLCVLLDCQLVKNRSVIRDVNTKDATEGQERGSSRSPFSWAPSPVLFPLHLLFSLISLPPFPSVIIYKQVMGDWTHKGQQRII